MDVLINSLLDQEALKKSAFHEGLKGGLQKETITANLKGILDYMNDQLKEKEAMRSLIWTANHIIANAQEALEVSDITLRREKMEQSSIKISFFVPLFFIRNNFRSRMW